MKKKDSLRSPQQCIKNKLITLRFIFSFSQYFSFVLFFFFLSSFPLFHTHSRRFFSSRFVFILFYFFPFLSPFKSGVNLFPSIFGQFLSFFLSYLFIFFFFNLFSLPLSLFFFFLIFPALLEMQRKRKRQGERSQQPVVYKTPTSVCVHPLCSSLARTNPFFFFFPSSNFSILPILSMIYSRAHKYSQHKFVSSFVTRSICLPLDKQKS